MRGLGKPVSCRRRSQVEAKEQPEACQRGREPQRCGTSCIGEARRLSAVQISEKLSRIVPATVRRAAVRTQISKLDAGPRLDSADIGTKSRPLGALLPFGGVVME